MLFETYIHENAHKLDWQPMETLPWEVNTECGYKAMPCGIILRYEKDRKTRYTLVGNDRSGKIASGCSCCSTDWEKVVTMPSVFGKFTGWVWAYLDTRYFKGD